MTINPNRETLVWDEHTRETLVSYFAKIKAAAEGMISDQLNVEDFIEWLEACSQIRTRYGTDSVIGRLSQLVDMSSARIIYNKDKDIIYDPYLFDGFQTRVNSLEMIREGSSIKYKIQRKDREIATALANGIPVYIQQGAGASFKTDKYLLLHKHTSGFITIKDPFIAVDDVGSIKRDISHANEDRIIDAAKRQLKSTDLHRLAEPVIHDEIMALHNVQSRMWKVMDYLLQSKLVLKYEEVVIPDDFDDAEEVEDKKTVEQVKAKEERQKIRREKGIIPIFTPRNVPSSYLPSAAIAPATDSFRLYEWQKIEIPIADVDKWDNEEVFFGSDKDQELLHLAAMLTRPTDNLTDEGTDLGHPYERYGLRIGDILKCHNFFQTYGTEPKVRLVKVAMDRTKFFLDFKPIQRFFLDVKNKRITMSNALVRWNTARLINEDIHQLQFLQNFERFHPKYCQWYRELVQYVRDNYRELKDHSRNNRFYSLRDKTYDDLVAHMDKVTQLQLFVRNNPSDTDKITQLVKDMFNPETKINDGLSIEMPLYDRLKELLDFSQPICILLNAIQLLTDVSNRSISEELEQEIRHYCHSRGVNL